MQLPLFPLELVVYPGESLNLHIFEPRYKQLINEVKVSGGSFGIVAHQEGENLRLGTEVKLKAIAKNYSKGEMDIHTEGLRVFEIANFEHKMEGKPYPGGEVIFKENYYDSTAEMALRVLDLVRILYDMMKITKKLPSADSDFSVFSIAHKIGLSFRQEQHLITITKESERQEFVLEHLEHLIPVIKETEAMKKKILMNGHFKHLTPPKF